MTACSVGKLSEFAWYRVLIRGDTGITLGAFVADARALGGVLHMGEYQDINETSLGLKIYCYVNFATIRVSELTRSINSVQSSLLVVQVTSLAS